MNEMIRNFSNDVLDISKPAGIEMAARILDHIRLRMQDFQEETGNLYNLEATPAEGTSYRLAKEDYKRFPGIIQAGTYPNIYYTNSSQLPVNFSEDPFAVLDLQDKLQCKYTGGTVQHLYMSERIHSTDACKKFVKTVLENYRLPYITISPVFSICAEHGYLNGEQEVCPTCGEKSTVWARVVGYFRPVDSFNIGKKGEHAERVYFNEQKE
jgi:ribonucleoside-triphosphate reductase